MNDRPDLSPSTSILQRMASAAGRVPAPAWVALLVTLAQLPILDRTVVTLDEGQVTAIGHRLASGQVLYRDVHTGLFPGLYWLVDVLFRIFGTEVLVLRWTQLAVNTATAVLLFVLARPFARGAAAWLVPLGYWVLVVLSFPVFTMLTYSPLSLLAALGALVFCRRYVVGARVADGLATGVLLGLCTVFKQNFGALALVAVFFSALWARRQGRLAEVPLVRAFAIPVAGGAAVAALAALRLALSGAWPAFYEATFVTLVGSQMDAFNQPLPPLFGSHPDGGPFYFLYAPGAVFGAMFQGARFATIGAMSMLVRVGYGSAYLALLLAPVLAWRYARHPDVRVRVLARFLFPFAVLFFPGIFPSAIWSHLVVVYPPLLVVLAAATSWLLEVLDRRQRVVARGVRLAGCAAILAIVVMTGRLELGTRRANAEPLGLPSATLHVAPRDAVLYRESTTFLRECAAAGEPVFVAPYMPLLYVTSGRPNPTPNDLLISIDVKEDVVLDRLKASGVRCMVFNPQMYVQFQPFERTYPKLAEYFATAFEEVGEARVGDTAWKFLRRTAPAKEAR